MGVIGQERKRPLRRKFLVEIDGITHAGYQSCSALEAEFGESAYFEGGAMIPDKQPTGLTYSDLTLERATAEGDTEQWQWWLQTANAAGNVGQASPGFKRNLDIVQLDRDDEEIRRWTIYNAWIKKFTAGEWDNTSDDRTNEILVLAFDYFELTFERGAQ